MNIFEDIFTESHKSFDSKKKKNSKRVTESKKKKLNEGLYEDVLAIQNEFGDVDSIRDELGIESDYEKEAKFDLGNKIVDMLNARLNTEMDINNPGFELVDIFNDDGWITIEIEDGDGYLENGSADSTGKTEDQLIKEIVQGIIDNLVDGEYCRQIKLEKSKKDIDKELGIDDTEEGFIKNEFDPDTEFDPIDEDTLTGCDLLTRTDFEEYQENIPAIDMDWWIQDAAKGATENVQYVDTNNEIIETGKGIYDYLGVRPYVEGDFEIGEEFSFNGYDWVAYSENRAICTGIIGTMDFDTTSNNYDKSLIRDFLHDWAGGFDISDYEDEVQYDSDEDEELDDEDDEEFIIESNDDWKYGYKITW